ncbi:hypothetical protein F2P81_020460 [Scophthalmus maximus]|uniref:Myelin and lymphocyte protein n=1 Tax=Scophthalmus maximus TaxID=52904 RepID=A0A6A4S591_SCOMX|nr:hypothetical protein F2P81_020460 [Scophthalmus maximus]
MHIQVIGGLVWILVASTRISPENPLGWVMFASIFCFVVTTLWFFIFLCGANQSSVWPSLDVGYHFVAVVFYLSAAVDLAYITILKGSLTTMPPENLKIYRLDIAAVVMSYLATLLYFLHAIFSAMRWKTSEADRSRLRVKEGKRAEMAATTTQPMGSLPSGLGICTTAPDIFYLPELMLMKLRSSLNPGEVRLHGMWRALDVELTRQSERHPARRSGELSHRKQRQVFV